MLPRCVPTVYALCGFIGVGKTTFAKRLERERRAVRYTPDEWMVRLFGEDPPADSYRERLNAIFSIIHAHWPRVVRAGADVVLDFGFFTRQSRDEVRELVASQAAEFRLIVLRCREQTARRRYRERNRDPGGSLFIADATYDALKPRFDPPGRDEPHELVDTESGV